MNELNSILIEGTLIKDPLFRSTAKGTSLCTFCVSNNSHKEDVEHTPFINFFEVECWSKLAESVRERGKKGLGVRIVGRLKQDRWTDVEGKLHTQVSIVAEHVEFRPETEEAA